MLKAHEKKHEAQKHQATPSYVALHVLRGKPSTDILARVEGHINQGGKRERSDKGNDVAQQDGKF
jgi:hypothetical protein